MEVSIKDYGAMVAIHSGRVELAKQFAKQKHAFQLRNDGKTLYWAHLEHVVNNLSTIGITDEDVLCAGWLHDTIEDTSTDFDDIHETFGLQVAKIVSQVTKDKRLPKKEREVAYNRSLQTAGWQAHAIKLCDILANLEDLSNSPQSPAEKEGQVNNKFQYFEAIKEGLAANRERIPELERAVDRLNLILAEYGRPAVKV